MNVKLYNATFGCAVGVPVALLLLAVTLSGCGGAADAAGNHNPRTGEVQLDADVAKFCDGPRLVYVADSQGVTVAANAPECAGVKPRGNPRAGQVALDADVAKFCDGPRLVYVADSRGVAVVANAPECAG